MTEKWNVLSLLAFCPCQPALPPDNHGERMDAIYLKLDGIEGESQTQGFEKQIKLIAYNHIPAKREPGETTETYTGAVTLTKPVDVATPELYEYYRNGKTVKEGILTLCRRDKGVMLPFIIYTLTNVRISRMSNHVDAGECATETVDLVYSHIRWDIPALVSKSKTRSPLRRQELWR
ncbi:cytoplasmic protein [Salmonella bongori]|uniref:Cytoplasmic protein n=2 Tax=Salmonella TaxID=590 RepID=A0A750KG95_SALER|nr:type VI secretion system tube protein Hcp [Salmonella bongori]EGE4653220.1 cytoplasmic protein [Salmonella bongori serovar 40:z35:- str. 95-0123]EGE4659804.1 cytoplasmic protein [Salmonella bongori serovar 48:i:- str. 94-0708]EGS1128062.1 cytoplasmic protein [Salmonella bongori CFSAN000509]HAC6693535.1 cytoplasmic protein [Salmonella bongori serovar 44:r:-]ECC8921365.1 cytoplasmic protein [Salmonella bongori]